MNEHDHDFHDEDISPAEHGRRVEERDSLFLQATIHRIGARDPVTVRVRNLSPGGMMAELGTPFAPGDRLVVELRGIGTIEGAVRWREAGRIGIAFECNIDPQSARKTMVQRPPAKPAPGTPPRLKRPRLFG